MRLPDASAPVQPATSGVDAESGEVQRDVPRATDRRGLASEPHDGDGCLGRDAGDVADQVAVEHQVADHEHLHARESAAHACVHQIGPVKHRRSTTVAPSTRSQSS